jgi:hypothetical protein
MSNVRRLMHKSTLAVFASWLLATAIIGPAIFSTPYMRGVLRGEAVESAAESLGALALGAFGCGWPWILALMLPNSKENQERQVQFAVVSFLLACVFYFLIADGHDFSTGLYTILYVLSIWIAYPMTRKSRAK